MFLPIIVCYKGVDGMGYVVRSLILLFQSAE